MTFKRFVGYVLYNAFGKHLPCSSSKIKIGQKNFRAFCGRLFLSSCGKNVNIEKGAEFSWRCCLGNNSGIGINSVIQGSVDIGNDVMMGPNCVIYTKNHEFSRLDIPMNQQGFQKEKKVIIGDDVWIGGNVTILPGVIIGDHSILGARAVVSKNVPEYAIVVGNPARVVKYRDSIGEKTDER